MQDANVVGAFGEQEASRLTGVSIAQLREWDRSGFLQPSFAAENRRLPYSRVYSFRDIVSLRVLNALRNEQKVPLQHLRKVAKRLAHLGEAKWTAATLYVLGKRVVFDDPRTNERQEIVSGQRVFDIPLRVAISSTKQAIQDMNHRQDDELGKIVSARFIQQNEPVFEGTRVPVATIKRYLDAGYKPEAIVEEFPQLSLADIEAARLQNNGSHAA